MWGCYKDIALATKSRWLLLPTKSLWLLLLWLWWWPVLTVMNATMRDRGSDGYCCTQGSGGGYSGVWGVLM
jgi:hypothetical protein